MQQKKIFLSNIWSRKILPMAKTHLPLGKYVFSWMDTALGEKSF
jgi:hypothetical protein